MENIYESLVDAVYEFNIKHGKPKRLYIDRKSFLKLIESRPFVKLTNDEEKMQTIIINGISMKLNVLNDGNIFNYLSNDKISESICLFTTANSDEKETVDHPSHYGGKDNPYEVIKIIEALDLDFNLGNTIKYIVRIGKKDKTKTLEDLRKALWYLQREISNLDLLEKELT